MSLVMKPVSRPRSRRRSALLFALVAAVALMAGACAQKNTPTAYNDVTQTQFLAGCTGNTSDDAQPGNTANDGDGPATTLAPQSACQCAYNWIVLNVPYNDANKSNPITIEGIGTQNFTYTDKTFESINNDLADDPGSIPEPIQTGLANECKDEGWVQATTTTTAQQGGPTTSTPS
jgi:hypothetical protein